MLDVPAALGRIGVQANIEIVPAADFTASLLSRRFDGSAAVWKDPERERVLIFSEPYLENRLILVGRRGSDVSATSFAALKGKKIAGSSPGGSATLLGYRALRHFGLEPGRDVSVLPMGGSAASRFAVLESGVVDASLLSVP